MKSVTFLKGAATEFYEVIKYYNDERPGLGFEFASEVNSTIKRILQFPESWQLISQEARRCPVARFPYGVLYLIEDQQIVIVAVMHAKRKPLYWEKRIR